MLKKFLLVLNAILLIVVTGFAVQNRITTHKAYFTGSGLSGNKILYMLHQSGSNLTVWSMNEDGTGQTLLINDNLFIGSGAIFPNKTKAVLVERDDNSDYLKTVNIDGTNLQTILTTNKVIGQVNVSPDAQKIVFSAYDPSISTDTNCGTLYLMNIDGSNMHGLSLNNGLKPIATNVKMFLFNGSTPPVTADKVLNSGSLAFSTDSTKVAFVDSYGYISVVNIDGSNLVEITTFTVEGGPVWLKTNKIIFQQYDYYSNKPFIIGSINPDGSSYTVLYSTTSDISAFEVSPDESKIAILINYGFSSGKSIAIVSTTGTFIKSIPFSTDMPFTMGCNWVNDTKIVIGDAKNLYTINIDTPVLTNITNNTVNPLNKLIDAKGNKVIYTPDMTNIYSINTDGTGNFQLFGPSATQFITGFFQLSPDGTKLMYGLVDITSANPHKLYVRNSDGSGSPILIEENTSNPYFDAKWSPKGTKIMFRSPIDGRYYVIDANGQNKKPVIGTNDNGWNFTFSPDDSLIMFSGIVGTQNGIYKTDLSTPTVVLATSTVYYIFDWKSDTVLLCSENAGIYSIYVMSSSGTNLKLCDDYIIPEENYETLPKLSPDGKKVAYNRYNKVNFENDGLYVYNTVNGTAFEVTDITYPQLSKESYFNWSSDGTKLIYSDFLRMKEIVKIYSAVLDGTVTKTCIATHMSFFETTIRPVSDNKVVYDAGLDIWTEDFIGQPSINVSVSELEFGNIGIDESKTMTFEITNTGGGTLSGTISDDKDWITVNPVSFTGNTNTISVTVDNKILKQGEGNHSGTINITSNGGNVSIAVKLTATCVLVKPNPYDPNRGVLKFFGDGIVKNKTTIRIYTLGGELVKELKDIPENEIIWDGKNESGDTVVNGVYLYTYESPKEKGIDKFTVITK